MLLRFSVLTEKPEEVSMSAIKFIHFILWLAFAIGVGEALVGLTHELRGAAIKAHRKGPISHKLFTEQLTGKK